MFEDRSMFSRFHTIHERDRYPDKTDGHAPWHKPRAGKIMFQGHAEHVCPKSSLD